MRKRHGGLVDFGSAELTGRFVVFVGPDRGSIVLARVGLREDGPRDRYEIQPFLAFNRTTGALVMARHSAELCEFETMEGRYLPLLVDGTQLATFEQGHQAFVYAQGLISLGDQWESRATPGVNN